MKYLFTILVACSISFASKAQSCNYYYLQNNKTLEITILDKKQKMSGKLIYNVTDVKNSSGSVTSKINSEIQDKNGKLIGSNALMAF